MKHVLFCLFLCGILCLCNLARAQQKEDPLLQPEAAPEKSDRSQDQEIPSDLQPNLSLPSNLWSRTSPQAQIALGIGDIIFIGYFNQFNDPEYKAAAAKYHAQDKIRDSAQKKYDRVNQKKLAEQKSLQEIKAESDNLEKTIAAQVNAIKDKQITLEKTRAILTADERELQIAQVKKGIEALHIQAVRGHQSRIAAADDWFLALSIREQDDLKALTTEYNSLREMPSVNQEEKAVLIRNAENDLAREQDSHEKNIINLRKKGDEAVAQAQEIETFDAQLADINKTLAVEKMAAESLKKDMELVAKSKRIKMFGRKIVRVGGRAIFCVDLGSRLYYYFVAQEDPGWFPFATLLQRVAF